jgi:hypothetical protein
MGGTHMAKSSENKNEKSMFGMWPIYDLLVIQDFANPRSGTVGSPNGGSSMVRIHMDVPVSDPSRLPLIAAAIAAGDMDKAYLLATQDIVISSAKGGADEVLKAAFNQ